MDSNDEHPVELATYESPLKEDHGKHGDVIIGMSNSRPSIMNDTIGGNLGLFAPDSKNCSTGSVPDGNRESSLVDTPPE